jgi:hypothetical protein
LMNPAGQKVNASDQFIKDKYVSEELRNLAIELDVLFVTASQLNRTAVDEIDFDHSHIAGGISKINTADNLIGIFTSRSMKERGRVQIQFMKTRSSSGVGQKLDLAMDMASLRISDLDDDDLEDTPASNSAAMMDKLKRQSETNSVQQNTTVTSVVDHTEKLRGLLKRME